MAKSPDAFRTISEAADELAVPQHVLRFWETKFGFLTPLKRAGGRRFYRPNDIVLLKAVKRLLHDEGLTIRGVQRLHQEQGIKRLAAYGGADAAFDFGPQGASNPIRSTPDSYTADTSGLHGVLADLERAQARLDAILST